jgi:hypothetical protein
MRALEGRLAARVPLRLARLPRTASSAQRSRRLRFTRATAPVLFGQAEVTNTITFFMGPKLRYPTILLKWQAHLLHSSHLRSCNADRTQQCC